MPEKPTPADLKARWPAFAAVPDATVQYWLTDAERIVTPDWLERDYAVGLMTLAAHEMVLNGVTGLPASAIPAGVTSFKSGTFSATVSESVANASAAGGFGATKYGQDFAIMLRRNNGMPRLVGCIAPVCC